MFSTFFPAFFSPKSTRHSSNYTFEKFQNNSPKVCRDVLRIYPKGEWTTNYTQDGKLSNVFLRDGRLDQHEILDEATQLVYELFHMVYRDPILTTLKSVGLSEYCLQLQFDFELLKFSVSEDMEYVLHSAGEKYRFRSDISTSKNCKNIRRRMDWFPLDGMNRSINEILDQFLLELLHDVETFVDTCCKSQHSGYLLKSPTKMDIKFMDSAFKEDTKSMIHSDVNKHDKVTFQELVFLEYSKGAVPVLTAGQPEVLRETSNDTIRTPNLDVRFCKVDVHLQQCLSSASSHLFYVVQGCGITHIFGEKMGDGCSFLWEEGDLFVLPSCNHVLHHSFHESNSTFLCVSDTPLFDFLSARPTKPRFSPLHYPKKQMIENLERVNREEGAEQRNRNGILLSNKEMVEENLNTLTPVLWSLYNMIGAQTVQKPHRHNSIAIDFCIGLHPESQDLVYTLMGPDLDENGNVKNPIRMNWKDNTVFTTPPGWWHSHHNDSEYPAMVFPIQDAGLHTYMNTLDIQFT